MKITKEQLEMLDEKFGRDEDHFRVDLFYHGYDGFSYEARLTAHLDRENLEIECKVYEYFDPIMGRWVDSEERNHFSVNDLVESLLYGRE